MVSEKIQCNYIKENGEQCGNKKLKENIPEDKREDWKCHQHQPDDEQNSTNKTNKQLTEKHLKAIDLLVSGKLTKTEIADRCDIARRTLYEWLDDPQFQKEFQSRLKEIRSKFNPKLTNLINEVMNSINVERFEYEKDKVSSLDKLFKVYQLINGDATEIFGGDGMKQETNIDFSGFSTEELKEFLEKM